MNPNIWKKENIKNKNKVPTDWFSFHDPVTKMVIFFLHHHFLATLKRAGTTREQLIKFYTTFIRPSLEYASLELWHPSITQTLFGEHLEGATYFTTHHSPGAEGTLEETGLPTLHTRRECLCLSFARSLYNNPAFKHWFPPQRQNIHNQTLRNISSISIPRCRSHRTLNTPIFYLSRLLTKWTPTSMVAVSHKQKLC